MNKILLDFINLLLPFAMLSVGILAALAGIYAPLLGIAGIVFVLFTYAHQCDMAEHFGHDRPPYPRQSLLVASLVTLVGVML